MTVYTVYITVGVCVSRKEYADALGVPKSTNNGDDDDNNDCDDFDEFCADNDEPYMFYSTDKDTPTIKGLVSRRITHDNWDKHLEEYGGDKEEPFVIGFVVRRVSVRYYVSETSKILPEISFKELDEARSAYFMGVETVKHKNPKLYNLLNRSPSMFVVKDDCSCCS